MNNNLPDNKLYKISEIAKILKVSIGTLRRWEKDGKLKSFRTDGGHRRYSLDDVKLITETRAKKDSSPTKLYKINEIANTLKVSIGTVRRWEREGLIKSHRTEGGHRRFDLEEIKLVQAKREIKKLVPGLSYKEINSPLPNTASVISPISIPESKPTPIIIEVGPLLNPSQKNVIKFMSFCFFSALAAVLISKANISTEYVNQYKSELVSIFPIPTVAKTILGTRTSSFPEENTGIALIPEESSSKVLAAAVDRTAPIFNVNIQSSFKEVAEFVKGLNSLDVSTGTLTATGAATLNGTLDVTGATTLGAATAATLNAATLSSTGNATFGNITRVNGITYSFPAAQGTGSTFLKNDGTGTLTWGSVSTPSNLSDLSGSLGVSQGGTNNTAAYTSGSIIFSNGTKLTENNSSLFWDTTNNRLGLLTTTPTATLSVGGSSQFAVNSTGNITKINGVTYSWPSAQGAASSTLQNDGTGTLSWATATSVTGSGATNDITYWSGTSTVAGSTNFTWNNGTSTFGVTGTSNLSGAVTLGGATTDLLTFTGRIASGTSLIPAVNLGSDLGTSSLRFNNLYVGTVNSNSTLSTTGQALFTYPPTDTTYGQSSVEINPTSPVANGFLLGIGVAGAQRAGIDAEGDLTLGYAGGAGTSAPNNAGPLAIYNHGTTNLLSLSTTGVLTQASTATTGNIVGVTDTGITTGTMLGLTAIRSGTQYTGDFITAFYNSGDFDSFGGNFLNFSDNGPTTKYKVTNAGTMISAAGAKWQPVSNSTTALNIANATGTNILTFDTTNQALSLTSTVATSVDIFSATSSAITSGNFIKLGEGGNQTFSGNGIFMDFDNQGGGGLAFTGNFLKLDTNSTDKFVVSSAGTVSAAGVYQGTSGTNTRLEATGNVTGNGNNGSIYFLDSTGLTNGRYEAIAKFGNGADGAISVSSSKNINTTAIEAGRPTCLSSTSCADGIAYRVNAPASGATTATRFSGADTLSNGIAAGDELLLINLQGISGDSAAVGTYEFLRVSSVTASTITFSSATVNSYTGNTAANQKVVVQRVPNYTNVTIASGGTLTASAWEGLATAPAAGAGYLTGIVAFRATGTVSVAASQTINANSLGYAGGAAGTGGQNGGSNGESYEGSNGRGGNATGTTDNAGQTNGGGRSGAGALASPADSGTRGGGAGGGASGSSGGGSSGGGGGYAGGGGGGGGSGVTAGTGGAGGAAGAAGTSGGGGGGGCGTSTASNGGAGGAGGVAGSNATSCNAGGNGVGGAAGVSATNTGSGGGGGAGSGTQAQTGGGGGGGGNYGTATLTTLFHGSGGGGGGGSGGTPGAGAAGGGIVYIAGATITVTGNIQANGTNGNSGSGNNGHGGAGAGGSVYLIANTATLGSSLVTASGGTGVTATAMGGSGSGSVGRIFVQSTSSTGTTSPAASTSSSNNYGTFYLGATNTTAADLAEQYPTNEVLYPGDVVELDPNNSISIRKATTPYSKYLLGVISTDPGVILGSHEASPFGDRTYPVALSGRVPVKIDPDSDPISIGDFLTSSDKPGYAKRSTKGGYAIGKALESWDRNSTKETISVFIHLGYYMGDMTADGYVNTGQSFVANDIKINVDSSTFNNLFPTLPSNITNVATDSGTATDSGAITKNVATSQSDVSLSQTIASLVDRLQKLEADDIVLKNQQTLNIPSATASSSGSFANLSVLGMSTLSDTVVTGKFNVGILGIDSKDGSINSIGALKIQPLRLGNVEFMNGLVTIDTNGNLIANKVTAKKYAVSGKSAGSDKIPAGQTSLDVATDQIDDGSIVLVTPSTSLSVPLVVTEKTKGVGFKVQITSSQSTDVGFDWWIVDKQ